MKKDDAIHNGELVRYDSELNEISFKGFTAEYYNIFMAIISRMRDKDDTKVTLSYARIRQLIDYPKSKTNIMLTKALDEMWDTLRKCECTLPHASGNTHMVLFPTYTPDANRATLTIRVNPDFAYLLNDFHAYTEFELRRFIEIKSRYGKDLFRLLRQYSKSGKPKMVPVSLDDDTVIEKKMHFFQISLDDLRQKFDVPAGYVTREITRKVVMPAVNECSKDFPGLYAEPFHLAKAGSPIAGYSFYWDFPQSDKKKGNQKPDGQIGFSDQDGIDRITSSMQKKSGRKNAFSSFEQSGSDYGSLEDEIIEK